MNESERTDRVHGVGLRIRHLLDERWRGRVRDMARDLDVPYTTLNRVVHGQTPPLEVLLAICITGNVSPGWLLTGEQPTSEGKGPRQVVLSDRLLPPVPTHEVLPAGVATVLVPPTLETETVYAYRLRPADRAVRAKRWNVTAGDILFLDNHPLLLVLAGRGDGPTLLVVWTWSAAGGGREGCLGDLRLTTDGWVGRILGRRLQKYRYDGVHHTHGDWSPELPAEGGTLTPNHLAAVCRGVTRIMTDQYFGRVR